jgi:DME family drug/metabolite transporter
MPMQQTHRRGVLLICCAALLWSTGGLGIKAIADLPLKVTFYRSVFAAVVLLFLFRRRVLSGTAWRPSPSFAIAVISYAACLTSFVVATKWTTAANAIFLQYAGVVWVLLLAPFVVREPIRRQDVIAIAVALCGMALLFTGPLQARGMAGNVLALLSSVFFAALVLALRREQRSSEAAVTAGNVVAAVALFPFVAHDLALTPRSAAILLFLGVFQLGFAYALFVQGLKSVTATEASLTGMLEPVANPIWVFFVVGERPTARAIVGGAIVIGAIAWRTFATGAGGSDLLAPD